MNDSAEGSIPRREALRKVAVVAVAAAATSVAPAAVAAVASRSAAPKASASRGQAVIVFRLRTRNTRACRACEIHHRYMIYISHARADRNRAHPNCNCPITKEKLPKAEFRRIFLDTHAIRDGMVDLRKLGTREGSRRGTRVGGSPPKRHAVGGKRTA